MQFTTYNITYDGTFYYVGPATSNTTNFLFLLNGFPPFLAGNNNSGGITDNTCYTINNTTSQFINFTVQPYGTMGIVDPGQTIHYTINEYVGSEYVGQTGEQFLPGPCCIHSDLSLIHI